MAWRGRIVKIEEGHHVAPRYCRTVLFGLCLRLAPRTVWRHLLAGARERFAGRHSDHSHIRCVIRDGIRGESCMRFEHKDAELVIFLAKIPKVREHYLSLKSP